MAKSKPTVANTIDEANTTAAEVKPKASAKNAADNQQPDDIPAKANGAAKTSGKSLIYVGADLPGFKANTVFSGEIPKKLDVDFVRELVISVDELPAFLKKKAVSTSREAFCYRKSVEYANTFK